MAHPCQYSPEVLVALEGLLARGDRIHDPFAGPGLRLGALCDRIGATFSGTDLEDWPDHDPRVKVGDARNPDTYPDGEFLVVTSPVYVNKRCADYANGPTPTTKVKGRRDYGIALGRALHPDNLARTTGRPARAEDYWSGHGDAVKHWPSRVIVNVDQPIARRWVQLLNDNGYGVGTIVPAYTRRYGGLDNAGKRADYEVIMMAAKGRDQTDKG